MRSVTMGAHVARISRVALLSGLVAGSLGTAAESFASWKPELVGGTLSAGFESRPLEGSEADIDPDEGQGDGRYWFAPPEDWGGTVELWSRWKFRSPVGKTKVKLLYGRNDWLEGGIFAQDILGLDLVHGLGAGLELSGELEYLPEVYKRHRADKDAAPGEPRYRPETYEGLELQLAFGKSWERFGASLLGVIDRRDENRWFEERDRFGLGAGLGLDLALWSEGEVRASWLRTSNESRNEPDLGSDLSFDEDSFELQFEQGIGSLRVELEGQVDLIRYTTSDVEDDSRFGREDTGTFLSGRIAWERPGISPFLGLELSRRSTKLSQIAAEDQDDGEDERTLARVGCEFQWAP